CQRLPTAPGVRPRWPNRSDACARPMWALTERRCRMSTYACVAFTTVETQFRPLTCPPAPPRFDARRSPAVRDRTTPLDELRGLLRTRHAADISASGGR